MLKSLQPRGAILTVAALVAALGLAACEEDKGPAERAGESIDKAVERAGDAADKAMKDAKKAAEKAGDSIDEAVQDAKEKVQEATDQ